jgi:hypothetical protein
MLAWLSALLFVVGGFAANGHELFGWSYVVWLLGGLAAWVLYLRHPQTPAMPARRPRP